MDVAKENIKEECVTKEDTEIVENIAEIASNTDSSEKDNTVKTIENQPNDRRTCSLEFYPEETVSIEDFRSEVEKYFGQRPDIVEKVVECKVENYGTRVKFICTVRKRMWLRFFNDPSGSYIDLKGVRRVVHACRNPSDCDQPG